MFCFAAIVLLRAQSERIFTLSSRVGSWVQWEQIADLGLLTFLSVWTNIVGGADSEDAQWQHAWQQCMVLLDLRCVEALSCTRHA